MRSIWLASIMILGCIVNPAHAANVLFGIAEGVAQQSSFGDLQDKYQPLADYLGHVLKAKITLESSQSIKSALANLAKDRYQLMFCRPASVTAKAIRDDKYQLVAMGDGKNGANFIVRKDSGFKNPQDILSHTIAMPQPDTFIAKVGLATIRDMGGKLAPGQVHYAHYQEAINFMVENKFVDIGVVAPVMVKPWLAKGGVVLFKSKNLPFWAIIASPKVSKDEVRKMQKALLDMGNTDEGIKMLAKIGVKGWLAGNPQDYVDMLTWLGI